MVGLCDDSVQEREEWKQAACRGNDEHRISFAANDLAERIELLRLARSQEQIPVSRKPNNVVRRDGKIESFPLEFLESDTFCLLVCEINGIARTNRRRELMPWSKNQTIVIFAHFKSTQDSTPNAVNPKRPR